MNPIDEMRKPLNNKGLLIKVLSIIIGLCTAIGIASTEMLNGLAQLLNVLPVSGL